MKDITEYFNKQLELTNPKLIFSDRLAVVDKLMYNGDRAWDNFHIIHLTEEQKENLENCPNYKAFVAAGRENPATSSIWYMGFHFITVDYKEAA